MMKKSIEVEDGIHMEISWSEADAAKQALAGKQASDWFKDNYILVTLHFQSLPT